MAAITTHITVRDQDINLYTATQLGPEVIAIWDHEKGDEVAKVSSWEYAAWVLTLLQSL